MLLSKPGESLQVKTRWNRATIVPSKPTPRPTLTVVGGGLANVGTDEEFDAGIEAVPFLEELVEEDEEEGGDNELDDEEVWLGRRWWLDPRR
jgi:hypothetical protein